MDFTFLDEWNNRIYQGDCLKLMKQIPEEMVSLIVTDPPYGICYQNQFASVPHEVLVGDEGIDYKTFARESYRILRMNSHAYFFTRFDCYPYHFQYLKEARFTIKNCLVVQKAALGGIGDLRGSYASSAEWVIFCQKGRREFNRTKLLENRYPEGTQFHKGREASKRYKTRFPDCWFGPEYPKATCHPSWQRKRGIFHPTVKNVEFLSWLIQISSNPGELVFDGFMGTGSTAVAACMTERSYLGAEISPKYWEMAQKRILAWTKQNKNEGGA